MPEKKQFIDNPPYRWKEVRVFISSTFRDFHAERDYLIKNVFPDLRQWCEQYKLHLVDIDLRWGITKEQAESGKVIDICLEQIDGSRPFFVCMLGNRYGWVPESKDVPEKTKTHYTGLKDGCSVTHIEIQHAVLDPLTPDILVEEVPHSFFYFRDEKSLPEIIDGFSEPEKEEYQKTFFETEDVHRIKLYTLKEDIQTHFEKIGKEKGGLLEIEKRIFNYKPDFKPELANPEDKQLKGRFSSESLKEFGNRVKEDLKKALEMQYEERIKALSEKMDEDKLKTELDFHEAFVENRTRLFIGRTALLKKLHNYIDSDTKKVYAVYGSPGCGKSALLAKFYKDLKDKVSSSFQGGVEEEGCQSSIRNQQSEILLIPHFVGASPGSSAIYNLLIRMCEELKQKFNIEDELPSDTNKLPKAFNNFLSKATGKVVIIIDGLNQLDEIQNAHQLGWLPADLPENVKIIASTLEGDTKEALKTKTDTDLEVTLLNDDECREVIAGMPNLFCKSLEDKHINALLIREETRNPLYLKIAIDELRMFGSFDRLEEKLNEFPSTVIEMFESVLDRLEREHGEDIVERLFCLLECSRYGLTLQELKELLSDDTNLAHLVILRQIRDYLHNRGEVIDFFHRALSKAIRKKYFEEDPDKQKQEESAA